MSDGSGDDILERLVVIANGIAEFRTVDRNETDIGQKPLPALVVFDGDEEGGGEIERNKQAAARTMTCAPALSIVLEGSAREVSADLRTLRRKVIKAVLTDAPLAALLGQNGGMIYRGYETEFIAAEKIVARMWLRFEFKYVFAPAAL